MTRPPRPSTIHARPRERRWLLFAAVAPMATAASLGAWLWVYRSPPSVTPAPLGPVAIATTVPAARPTAPVAFTDGCLTAECHAGMALQPFSHAPVSAGACETCHSPDAGDHTFPVLPSGAATCSRCHDTPHTGALAHRDMRHSDCLTCHDPHGSAAPGLLAAPSIEQVCAQCHPPSTARITHAAYAAGRCDACHEPHEPTNGFPRSAPSAAGTCRGCHEPLVRATETLAYSHASLEGGCRACHEGHASDHPGLLRSEQRALCVGCHETVAASIASGVVSHDPVLNGERCSTCHDPHASPHAHMLRASQQQLCLSCHEKDVTDRSGRVIREVATALRDSPFVHGAIRDGECGACHAVHGGTIAHLLRSENPVLPLGSDSARHYALCFSCHDPGLGKPTGHTGFQDGGTNLHAVHLRSRDKAQSCGGCHAVHAGDLPHLIARATNFQGSQWAMPIGFVPSSFGGSCASGCHEALAYDRRPGGARDPRNRGSP